MDFRNLIILVVLYLAGAILFNEEFGIESALH